jgi:hypothetical protein
MMMRMFREMAWNQIEALLNSEPSDIVCRTHFCQKPIIIVVRMKSPMVIALRT